MAKKQLSHFSNLFSQFWRRDKVERISDRALRLYFVLIDECNRRRWLNPFGLDTERIIVLMGEGDAKRKFAKARSELIERGLLVYEKGKNRFSIPSYKFPFIPLLTVSDIIDCEESRGVPTTPLQESRGVSRGVPTTPLTPYNTILTTNINPLTPLKGGIADDVTHARTHEGVDDSAEEYRKAESNYAALLADYFAGYALASRQQFCMTNNINIDKLPQLARAVITDWLNSRDFHTNPVTGEFDRRDALRHLTWAMRTKNAKLSAAPSTEEEAVADMQAQVMRHAARAVAEDAAVRPQRTPQPLPSPSPCQSLTTNTPPNGTDINPTRRTFRPDDFC